MLGHIQSRSSAKVPFSGGGGGGSCVTENALFLRLYGPKG